jgi:phosphonate transport system ATP-binding protein
MELLASMNRDRGCTVLVSLHQVEFALKYCKRTIALHRGKVVYDGPSAELTPTLLGELYGTAVEELFDMVLDKPAQKSPANAAGQQLVAA